MAIVTTKNRAPKTVTRNKVNDVLMGIRKLLAKRSQTVRAALLCHIELGEGLTQLKGLVEHGAWLPILAKLGIEVRTAQRLMKFAGSPLASQMRALRPHLVSRMPLDIRTLVGLAKLPADEVCQALESYDLSSMSAAERKKAILGPDPEDDEGGDPDDELEGRPEDNEDDGDPDDDESEGDQDDDEDAAQAADEDTDEESDADENGEDDGPEDDDDTDYEDDPDNEQDEDEPAVAVIAGVCRRLNDDLIARAIEDVSNGHHSRRELRALRPDLTAARQAIRRLQLAIDDRLA